VQHTAHPAPHAVARVILWSKTPANHVTGRFSGNRLPRKSRGRVKAWTSRRAGGVGRRSVCSIHQVSSRRLGGGRRLPSATSRPIKYEIRGRTIISTENMSSVLSVDSATVALLHVTAQRRHEEMLLRGDSGGCEWRKAGRWQEGAPSVQQVSGGCGDTVLQHQPNLNVSLSHVGVMAFSGGGQAAQHTLRRASAWTRMP